MRNSGYDGGPDDGTGVGQGVKKENVAKGELPPVDPRQTGAPDVDAVEGSVVMIDSIEWGR